MSGETPAQRYKRRRAAAQKAADTRRINAAKRKREFLERLVLRRIEQ
jgi:hypothetical protein